MSLDRRGAGSTATRNDKNGNASEQPIISALGDSASEESILLLLYGILVFRCPEAMG